MGKQLSYLRSLILECQCGVEVVMVARVMVALIIGDENRGGCVGARSGECLGFRTI